MRGNFGIGRVAFALAAACAACAPTVDGPLDQQRARDRTDADSLAAQLRLLPGVTAARVELSRAAADPLSTVPPRAASASAVLVASSDVDRAQLESRAAALVAAAAPDVAHPAIVVAASMPPAPSLARVGPFTVAAADRNALRATLAAALAVVAGLSIALAARLRRSVS